MARRQGRLDDEAVGAVTGPAQCLPDQLDALAHGLAVPPRAVLVGQQHRAPVGVHARGAPRVLEQHQGQQPERGGVVGLEADEQPREPERLGHQPGSGEVGARGGGVPLVEEQVDGGQHALPAVGQLVVRRHGVGDAREADLLARAHQPLGDGVGGAEQRAGDLGLGEAAERAQRQRDAAGDRQARVAAGEEQPQEVVLQHARLHVLGPSRSHRGVVGHGALLSCAAAARLAQQVDRPPARGEADPRDGTGRYAVARPRLQCPDHRVLDGVLGQGEVAHLACERRQDVAARLPHQRRERGVRCRSVGRGVLGHRPVSPWG